MRKVWDQLRGALGNPAKGEANQNGAASAGSQLAAQAQAFEARYRMV
jgi:hypothetical protein